MDQLISNVQPIFNCKYCEEKFENLFEMQAHNADKHCEEIVQGRLTSHAFSNDSSFVFSEAKLDEFIYRDICMGRRGPGCRPVQLYKCAS